MARLRTLESGRMVQFGGSSKGSTKKVQERILRGYPGARVPKEIRSIAANEGQASEWTGSGAHEGGGRNIEKRGNFPRYVPTAKPGRQPANAKKW